MRFMTLLEADARTEAGELPSRQDLEIMGKYNQSLVDGPFAETKELIAGYWMIEVAEMERSFESNRPGGGK